MGFPLFSEKKSNSLRFDFQYEVFGGTLMPLPKKAESNIQLGFFKLGQLRVCTVNYICKYSRHFFSGCLN